MVEDPRQGRAAHPRLRRQRQRQAQVQLQLQSRRRRFRGPRFGLFLDARAVPVHVLVAVEVIHRFASSSFGLPPHDYLREYAIGRMYVPSKDTFNSSPGDPRGVPSTGGYSPEVYDLLLDAGGRLAAFYAAKAARARNAPEYRRWQNKLAALREEIADVDAQSNVSVVGKRNELLERYRVETSGSESSGTARGAS